MSRQRKWQLKRNEQGLCNICSHTLDCDSISVCWRCLVKRRTRARQKGAVAQQISGLGRKLFKNPYTMKYDRVKLKQQWMAKLEEQALINGVPYEVIHEADGQFWDSALFYFTHGHSVASAAEKIYENYKAKMGKNNHS